MITALDGFDLHEIKDDGPYITRILSLFEAYGESYDFVRFWVQKDGEETVSVISLFEDKMSLFLSERSDPEEISSFLRFQGFSSVMYDSRFSLDVDHSGEICGDVLEYRGGGQAGFDGLTEPEVKEYYELLCACASETFRIPPYLMFLSDVTHRKNRGKCRMLGIRQPNCSVGDPILASAAMTVSFTENAVILGAVATHPEHRKRGLSRQIVCSLAEEFFSTGKRVFVLSAEEKNTRFYEHSGFEIVSRFSEKFRY